MRGQFKPQLAIHQWQRRAAGERAHFARVGERERDGDRQPLPVHGVKVEAVVELGVPDRDRVAGLLQPREGLCWQGLVFGEPRAPDCRVAEDIGVPSVTQEGAVLLGQHGCELLQRVPARAVDLGAVGVGALLENHAQLGQGKAFSGFPGIPFVVFHVGGEATQMAETDRHILRIEEVVVDGLIADPGAPIAVTGGGYQRQAGDVGQGFQIDADAAPAFRQVFRHEIGGVGVAVADYAKKQVGAVLAA